MHQLAKFLLRWIVTLVGAYVVGVYAGLLGMLLAAWVGFEHTICMVVYVYTAIVAMALTAVFISGMVDQWQKRSPVITTQHFIDVWNWWKRHLRDPLRAERLLRSV